MEDFDDIFGAPAKKRGRPKGVKNKPKDHDAIRFKSLPSTKLTSEMNVHGGVTLDWLSKVFGMSRKNVIEALRPCPVMRMHQNGGAYYDLKVAAAYLVKPERELAQVLADLKADDLPEKLRESFWNAKIKEMKFLVMAGDLWPTESVLEVLAQTFTMIRTKVQLWTDSIEDAHPLTTEQRQLQQKLADQLLSDIKTALVENAKVSATESYAAVVKEVQSDE
ncbi:terminase small subunit protein [Rhizobium phage RHph_X2_30]|nr:terminase small subunit protein [Rhizobium phage RHph_X2_30]